MSPTHHRVQPRVSPPSTAASLSGDVLDRATDRLAVLAMFVCRRRLDCDVLKVLDFGLVAVTRDDADAARDLSLTGNKVIGTPAYIAPDTVLGTGADHRVDLYALGCVAFFALTGRMVFEADTPRKMALRHVEDAPPAVCDHAPSAVPDELAALIAVLLSKSPDDRPQSSVDVLRSLDAIAAAHPWAPAAARACWDESALVGTGVAVPPTRESPGESA